MITRIYIDNYRCFTNFEFVPQRINLLLGVNGSGKSALFEVLTGLTDVVVHSVEIGDVFAASSRTRWESRPTQRMELDVDSAGRSFRYLLVVDWNQNHAIISEERVTSDGKTLFSFHDGQVHLHKDDGSPGASFPFRGNRSFLAQIEQRPETRKLMAWKAWMSELWSLGLNVREMDATSKEEDEKLVHDGSNFASWYRHFSQESPDRLQSLWSSLGAALPGFRILKLESSGRDRGRDLAARMMLDSTEYQLYFDELSDGQRALIVLYTLLEARAGQGCLLLDEPESHIGLTEVQPWLVELDTRFTDNGQVFLASHNPAVIDYMAASHPFLFERPGGGPARIRPAVFDRESGLTASQQITRGLFDDA